MPGIHVKEWGPGDVRVARGRIRIVELFFHVQVPQHQRPGLERSVSLGDVLIQILENPNHLLARQALAAGGKVAAKAGPIHGQGQRPSGVGHVDAVDRILADELESNTAIRVNSIDPGRVRTRMRALAFPGENPMDNPAPEDIMNSYVYLMSDESKNINGKIISCKQ